MMITTTDFIPNYRILEIKDVVFSEQVHSVNAAKDIMNGIKGIFGGALESYSEEYRRARENAIDDLKKQVEKLGGNAVIHLQTAYSEFINSDMLCVAVMVSGTVVKVEPVEG